MPTTITVTQQVSDLAARVQDLEIAIFGIVIVAVGFGLLMYVVRMVDGDRRTSADDWADTNRDM